MERISNEELELEIEFADRLFEISRKLNIPFKYPEIYRSQDFIAARIIHEVLTKGIVQGLLDYPQTTGTGQAFAYPDDIPGIISQYENSEKAGKENTIATPIPEQSFPLLEKEIRLGPRIAVLHILSIEVPMQDIVTLDTGEQVQEIQFRFDPSKSFTMYEKWCSDEDREKYFRNSESDA